MNFLQDNISAEDTALRADRDLRAVADISPYPVFIHYGGIIRHANELAKKLIKEKEDAKLEGRHLSEFIYKEDQVKLRIEIEKRADSETSGVMDFRLVDRTGLIQYVQSKSIPVSYDGALCRLVHVYNFDRAEQAIEDAREKEALLEKLIEAIPDSLLLTDATTRKTLYSNKSFIDSLGYTAADHSGEDEYQLIERKIHPEDQAQVRAVREQMNDPDNTGRFASAEYRVQASDGSWRWILSRSCRLLPSRNGKNPINFGIIQDITDLKAKEQELISYQLFQQKVNTTSPALITIFEIAKMTSIYHSKDMGEWFNYAPGTFPKQSFDVIHPEYRKEALNSLHRVSGLQDGDIQTTVYPALEGDGTVKFILTRSGVFQRDADSKATHILLVHSDITDMKEVESRLDRSEETRNAILYSIPDMVVILDKDGVISDFYPNEGLRHSLEDMDFAGRNINELISQENAIKLKAVMQLALGENKLHTENFEHKGDKVTYHMELRISPFAEDKVIIVGRDIAEQKESQDKIQHYNKELFEKNQELERYITSNSELEKFAYIASHDLREPLRSLTGFAQLLQKRNEGNLTKESEDFIENIIHGAHRMNTLVSGLLEYSRITGAGKPFAIVHIPDLIRKVRSDLKISIEENKTDLILFDLPEDLYCDELQMRQLFQNLISNAIKFRSERNPIIKISAEKMERHWQFKIEDNGIGIDARYKEQVFQIFTRLHSQDKYQGSGIGLSVCKKIIERHGGQIWLESMPGHGTTIFFTVAI